MICAIIQARMSSSRLPGKVLLEVNGRPLLSYMLERISKASTIDRVVVATSTESADDQIEMFCRRENVSCYRGSLDDVLDRYYHAALHVNCDVVVRLTSDCPLLDPAVIDEVVKVYQSRRHDYVANTVPPGGTFPDGMDVEVFSLQALEKAWKEARKPSEREHVTFYFWKNSELFSTYRYDLQDNLSKYRLTVDYPEDFEVIQAVLTELYQQNTLFTLKDIINYLEAHPGIIDKNKKIVPNQGWLPALEKDIGAGFLSE